MEVVHSDEKTGPQPQEYDRWRRYVARWSSLTTGQHNVMRLMHLSQIIHNNSYKFSNIHKIIWIRVSNCSIRLRRSATSIFSLYLLFLSNSYRKHEEDIVPLLFQVASTERFRCFHSLIYRSAVVNDLLQTGNNSIRIGVLPNITTVSNTSRTGIHTGLGHFKAGP